MIMTKLIDYIGGLNTKHVWNSNGRDLFCFPMVEKRPPIFPMNQTIAKQNFRLDHFMNKEKL